jgi:hypothetical protein
MREEQRGAEKDKKEEINTKWRRKTCSRKERQRDKENGRGTEWRRTEKLRVVKEKRGRR